MGGQYGCPEEEAGRYTCYRTVSPPVIDGRLEDPCWRTAPRSPRFVDLVSGEQAPWDTRMAALWDDEHLYVAFWVEEPDVRARFTERDSPLYLENDVEVFIAGRDAYYELEVNAMGTLYEVFFIWKDTYREGGFINRPEFDLAARDVDILGGFQDGLRYGRHPRGARWAFRDWDFPGLQSGVHVEGTLNDSRDVDKGWTVELAFPWKGMEVLAGRRALPPEDGDTWRMQFFRFEAMRLGGIPVQPPPGWAFNRHGVYDSHIPECFPFIRFSARNVEDLA